MIDEALDMQREIYRVQLRLEGSFSEKTLDAAMDLSLSLMEQNRYHEAKKFLCSVVNDEENDKFMQSCTTDEFIKLAQLMRTFAICLWKFHFYGYERRDGHDDYRVDLRNSIKYLEALQDLPDARRPAGLDADLSQARNEQLDWRVDDLTPATIAAFGRFGRAKLTSVEKAATLHAIEYLSSSSSSLMVQEYAESCLGAPAGALDAKKAAVEALWREAQSG